MGHAEPQAKVAANAAANAAGDAATRQPYWMPFTPNKEFKAAPQMFSRAKGMYFYTPEGKEVIDASAGLFCVAAGHCRQEIAQAVFEQLQTLDFTAPFLRAHPKAFELAEKVTHYTPAGLNRIFFTNSGSEAGGHRDEDRPGLAPGEGPAAAAAVRGPRAGLPRCELRRHCPGRHGQQPPRLWRGPGRGAPHAPHRHCREPLRHGPARAWRRPGRRPAALLQPVWWRKHRRLLCGTYGGLFRLPAAAQGVPGSPAQDLRCEWHPAGVR